MTIVCLDLEGVLVPEIWIEFSRITGIPEFARTTRDEPDYDKLMHYRLALLDKHGFGVSEVMDAVSRIAPFDGALEFLESLREQTQVFILSDTFEQFGRPIMRKLGWPALMCNSLIVDEAGRMTSYKLRCPRTKFTTVKALQSCGFETIAAGDSHNDLDMIRASKAGFLFRSTDAIKAANPDIPAFEDFEDLRDAIFGVLS